MDLRDKSCGPCDGTTPKLDRAQIAAFLRLVDGWKVEGGKLQNRFAHRDFRAAIAFVVAIADVAEAEQHHPDLAIHYKDVDVTVWTHSIDGLSENDFILAAKLDALANGATTTT